MCPPLSCPLASSSTAPWLLVCLDLLHFSCAHKVRREHDTERSPPQRCQAQKWSLVGIVGLARLSLPSANCTGPARHPYVEFVGVGGISGSSVGLGICSSVLGRFSNGGIRTTFRELSRPSRMIVADRGNQLRRSSREPFVPRPNIQQTPGESRYQF